MAKTRELSLAFVEMHPADAARVLDHLSIDDVTAFFALVPARLSAPLLRHMLPTTAARCLEQLDEGTASGLLRDLDAQTGTAILRYLSDSRRQDLLAQLPTPTAVAFRLLLAYPEDAVGAWVRPQGLTLPMDLSAHDALERVRQTDHVAGSYLYVVDTDQHLQGVVAITDLLRVGRGVKLNQIMHPAADRISARASLRAARTHAGWQSFSSLPVVERQDRFIGTLDFATLCHVLDRHAPSTATQAPDRGTEILAHAYWALFSGLIQSLISLIPTGRRSPRGS